LADLPGNVARAIALIDLPDLQWQVKRIGGSLGDDPIAVLEQLEAGLAKLHPAPEKRLRLGIVYVCSSLEGLLRNDAPPREAERVVFRRLATGIQPDCSACYKACTHCKSGPRSAAGLGRDNPIWTDLLELARKEEYDWAVVVSTDLRLIPVVRYLQAHGRKIIHGCFPPIAIDLTKECWASIDLRPIDLNSTGDSEDGVAAR
jgi:hypothetical protein